MAPSSRSSESSRTRLLEELSAVSRRYMASYALFNQAVADHLGLHPTDLQCLNLLTLEGAPVTTGRVAELTGLTTGSATRLVDRLEKDGLLRRDTCTDDGRGAYAVLTQKGAEALAEARHTHLDGVREKFLRQFDESELRVLAEYWERVVPGASGLT